MANVNMDNELGKFNNKTFREARLKELEERYDINALRESAIWESTGGKFETVFGEYMTNKQVAEFFKAGWDDNKNQSNLLKNYTAKSTEHFEELTNCGMKFHTKDELTIIRSEFQTTFPKGFENDTTESLSISNLNNYL